MKDKRAAGQCFETGLVWRPWLSEAPPQVERRAASGSKLEAEGPMPLVPLAPWCLRSDCYRTVPATSRETPGCLQFRHLSASTNRVQLSVQLPGQHTHQVFPTSKRLWKDRDTGSDQSQDKNAVGFRSRSCWPSEQRP